MTLRLHRVSDEQWRRLAATRRSEDRAGAPPRATIRAIEIELRTLGTRAETRVGTPADGGLRGAVAS